MRENFEENDFSREFYRWDQEKLQYRPVSKREEAEAHGWILKEDMNLYHLTNQKEQAHRNNLLPGRLIPSENQKILLGLDTCYVENVSDQKHANCKSILYLTGK